MKFFKLKDIFFVKFKEFLLYFIKTFGIEKYVQ